MAASRIEDDFERERQGTRRRGERAIDVAKQRARAVQDIEGAEQTAAQQQIGGVRRRTGQAVAAAFDPFQQQGGGQFAALGQVAADRGAQEGMIEADATRRIAQARVKGQEAELEALKFAQEATPSARQEFLNFQKDINQFLELDRGAAANSNYIMELASTAMSDDVYKRLVQMAQSYSGQYRGAPPVAIIDKKRYDRVFAEGGDTPDDEDL
tara:strand:+ start:56 stop:691 length:636 start_codon:yes stop_codon:yes gene_type:complete